MFIHELNNWTNFRYDAKALLDIVAEVNMAVGVFNGRLKSIGFDDQLRSSVEFATSNIVASSEVEGISLNSNEVRSSVARKLGVLIKEQTTPSHYVEGIVDMFLDAVMNYNKPLINDRLFSWHRLLFPSANRGPSDINIGSYRNNEMSVVSGMFGRERIHYRAPAPQRVAQEMDVFLKWFDNPAIKSSYIKSAIAHLWFVSIHPFDDGNGRIGRALSDMIFARIEDSGRHFFSISTQINRDKKNYYKALEHTQRGDGDITEWLLWFMSCIKEAVIESDSMLSVVLRKAVFWRNNADVVVTQRQKQVLNTYLDGYDAKISTKNWAKLADVSRDTAQRDINDLVEKSLLLPAKGKVRNVSYSIVYASDNISSLFTHVVIDSGFISLVYKGVKYSDKIMESDIQRLSAEEVTKDDMAYKYFSYLIEEQ